MPPKTKSKRNILIIISIASAICIIYLQHFDTSPKSSFETQEEFTTNRPPKKNEIINGSLELSQTENTSIKEEETHKRLPNTIDHKEEPTNNHKKINTEDIDNNFKLDEIYNDYTRDLSNIEANFIINGKMFSSNLSELKQKAIGTEVLIQMNGYEWSGHIQKNKPSPSVPGNNYVKVKFDGQGQYMTAYYYKNGSINGKIYTSDGSYIYESNSDVGFILSLYEYKKLNNALKID